MSHADSDSGFVLSRRDVLRLASAFLGSHTGGAAAKMAEKLGAIGASGEVNISETLGKAIHEISQLPHVTLREVLSPASVRFKGADRFRDELIGVCAEAGSMGSRVAGILAPILRDISQDGHSAEWLIIQAQAEYDTLMGQAAAVREYEKLAVQEVPEELLEATRRIENLGPFVDLVRTDPRQVIRLWHDNLRMNHLTASGTPLRGLLNRVRLKVHEEYYPRLQNLYTKSGVDPSQDWSRVLHSEVIFPEGTGIPLVDCVAPECVKRELLRVMRGARGNLIWELSQDTNGEAMTPEELRKINDAFDEALEIIERPEEYEKKREEKIASEQEKEYMMDLLNERLESGNRNWRESDIRRTDKSREIGE